MPVLMGSMASVFPEQMSIHKSRTILFLCFMSQKKNKNTAASSNSTNCNQQKTVYRVLSAKGSAGFPEQTSRVQRWAASRRNTATYWKEMWTRNCSIYWCCGPSNGVWHERTALNWIYLYITTKIRKLHWRKIKSDGLMVSVKPVCISPIWSDRHGACTVSDIAFEFFCDWDRGEKITYRE